MRRYGTAWLSMVLTAGFLLTGCITITTDQDPDRDRTATPTPARDSGAVTGSGNVITEEREVQGFDAVRLEGIGELYVEMTGTEALTIEAEDNIVPLLTSEVVDGELVLAPRSGSAISATEPIVYRLSVAELERISASGAGDVDARGIAGDRLAVSADGATDIRVTGSVDELTVEVSQSSSFEGRSLQSRTALVDASGSADAVVDTSQSLKVTVSGAADVSYTGNPELSEEVSGAGSVDPLD